MLRKVRVAAGVRVLRGTRAPGGSLRGRGRLGARHEALELFEKVVKVAADTWLCFNWMQDHGNVGADVGDTKTFGEEAGVVAQHLVNRHSVNLPVWTRKEKRC